MINNIIRNFFIILLFIFLFFLIINLNQETKTDLSSELIKIDLNLIKERIDSKCQDKFSQKEFYFKPSQKFNLYSKGNKICAQNNGEVIDCEVVFCYFGEDKEEILNISLENIKYYCSIEQTNNDYFKLNC